MDDLQTIKKSIERSVTHIARVHQTTEDVILKQMLLVFVERTGIKNFEVR